jgi:hypothetical protein
MADPVTIGLAVGAIGDLVGSIIEAANPPPAAVVTYEMPNQRKNQSLGFIALFFVVIIGVIVVPKLLKR